MKRSEIDGWVRATNGDIGLQIYHRPDAPVWVDTAAAYVRGDLAGLKQVDSAKTAEVAVGYIEHEQGPCYFKRYLHRDRLDPLKDAIRPSRARRALMNEAAATELGFKLPESLCLIERRQGPMLTYCALVTRAIDAAPTLREWLTKPELGLIDSAADRRLFLSSFAKCLAAWHEAGLHHGDLRLGNVLCRRDSEFVFYWLDNERNKRYAQLPARMRIHNLMRVNFEPCGLRNAERMRFWHDYIKATNVPAQEKRNILEEVANQTLARRRKYGWA